MRAKRGYVLGSSWRQSGGILRLDPATRKLTPDYSQSIWFPSRDPIDAMIRSSVLYADEIVQPLNDLLPQQEIDYSEYLEGQRVLRRVKIRPLDDGSPQAQSLKDIVAAGLGLSGTTNIPRVVAKEHFQIFKELEAQSQGNWAFGMLGTGMDLAGGITPEYDPDGPDPDRLAEDEFGVAQRGFKVELTNLLPVPGAHIGYDQLLDFKCRRLDELYELRDALDGIYKRVSNDRDKADSKAREIEQLKEALQNIHRLMGERRWPIFFPQLEVELSLGEAWEAALGLAQIAYGLRTWSLESIGFGVASMIKIKPKKTQSPELRAGVYKYVYHAAKEGLVAAAS